jgi:hypothetical protein
VMVAGRGNRNSSQSIIRLPNGGGSV